MKGKNFFLLELLADFDYPSGALLGVVNAAYSIGSVIALPIVPWVCARSMRLAGKIRSNWQD